MKTLLALSLVLLLAGCGLTKQQVTYQTLAATGETLKVSTALWKEYVQYAKDHKTVSRETLTRQALEVQEKVNKAATAYDLAVEIAGTTQAPTTSDIQKIITEAVDLINSYKK
jgi:outer membrane lipopolysaccharide assembly protein LptE/RlpB